MKRLLNYLSSLRFTLCLIVSLGVIFLLGLWIPQKGVLKKALFLQWKAASPDLVAFLDLLQLTDIHTSPITLSLWVLFFLNLSLVIRQRIPLVRKKIVFSDGKLEDPSSTAYPCKTTLEFAETSLEALPDILAQAGYRFYGSPDRFYAVKNRFAPIASLLFHLSFFLILLGGVIGYYSKFAGNLDLAEGESFHGELERYSTPPRLPKIGEPPVTGLTVKSITPESAQGVATGLKVGIVDDLGKPHLVEVNRPYKREHTSFVLKNLGVAPLFVIRDSAGRELDGAYVKLDVMSGKQDRFAMLGYGFTVTFYPDYAVDDGVEVSRSRVLRNPAFRLVISKDKRTVAEKTVRPKESVEFDGYRLSLEELPYWVRFLVVKELGLEIVYAGFVIATIALVWRLIFYRRELVGAAAMANGKTILRLAGRAEFYRALAEEEFHETVAAVLKKLGK